MYAIELDEIVNAVKILRIARRHDDNSASKMCTLIETRTTFEIGYYRVFIKTKRFRRTLIMSFACNNFCRLFSARFVGHTSVRCSTTNASEN